MKSLLSVVAVLLIASHVNGFSTSMRPAALQSSCASRAFTATTKLTSASSGTAEPLSTDILEEMTTTDAVICGGGPAGLLSAIMLAQKFPTHKIRVFDRLSAPPSPTDEAVWNDVAKFYLIGLGGRGQKSLMHFGVWPQVEAVATAVLGRKDWSPESSEQGVERIFTDRPLDTQVLPRDKLVGVLQQHILQNYGNQVELNYGYDVTPLDFEAGADGTSVVVRASKCKEVGERVNPTATTGQVGQKPDILCDPEDSIVLSTSLLIAADGTARTIANRMEEEDRAKRKKMNPVRCFVCRLINGKPFSVKRYEDDNQRIYKTIPMQLPADWRHDLNYSARTKGNRVTFDALPANRKGTYCGVLLLKKDDPLAKPNSDPKELREMLDESLPQFTDLVDDEMVKAIAKKPPSFLPGFRYVEPRLNQGHRTIMLGDCAHTVKPYFGLGANSALEDVKLLGQAIDETEDLSQAVHRFSKQRAGEAKALVRISRELDRPGAIGFVTFILPLILDSIFHGMAPKLFAPNMISMLQKEGYSFVRAARRKRLDRIAQLSMIGATLTGVVVGARFVVASLAKALGRRTSTVMAGAATIAVAATLLQKLAGYLVPGLAPADVLAKTKGSVSSKDLVTKDSKQGS